jgi:hypothetical protein
MVSDDATDDWATIGVKVLSVSLIPQGGGSPVVVYTAPSTPPMINLVQLDQLGEIIGNAQVPIGTYTSVQLTLGANNNGTTCDVSLVASGDPETGFDVPAGTTVPCSQIVIAGAQGTTVPLTLNLATPLTVTSASTNALDLEFDLKHPALIVEHDAPSATTPIFWTVNFNGPVRHHPRPDLTKVLLRHIYGQVATVASDGSSLTIDRAFPVHPITSPETATVGTTALPILPDAANGTLVYNLDGTTPDTPVTVTSFQSLISTLPTQYVRIAARYQQNGTLVATRIYSSATFNTVWKNPEGHVLHVNTNTDVMHVTTEDGKATAIAIGPNTNFYYQSSNTPITPGGTTFFEGKTPGGLPNIARGFKVNATIDPLSTATPPVALSVEIDVARYGGVITSPTSTGFNYNRVFPMADGRGGADNYSGTLDYISSSSANTDQAGNAITGFYWWDFAYPTLADTSLHTTNGPIPDFVAATEGSTNFGGVVGPVAGVVGPLKAVGLSNATWNDPAASDTWAADWAVLLPAPAPLGLITTAFSTTSDSFAFTVPLPIAAPTGTAAAQAVTVDLSVTSGSATLVYQVDRQGNKITITPQDISNGTTLTTVAGNLTVGVPVKVFGVPQADGSIKAYALFYYTNTVSTK